MRDVPRRFDPIALFPLNDVAMAVNDHAESRSARQRGKDRWRRSRGLVEGVCRERLQSCGIKGCDGRALARRDAKARRFTCKMDQRSLCFSMELFRLSPARSVECRQICRVTDSHAKSRTQTSNAFEALWVSRAFSADGSRSRPFRPVIGESLPTGCHGDTISRSKTRHPPVANRVQEGGR